MKKNVNCETEFLRKSKYLHSLETLFCVISSKSEAGWGTSRSSKRKITGVHNCMFWMLQYSHGDGILMKAGAGELNIACQISPLRNTISYQDATSLKKVTLMLLKSKCCSKRSPVLTDIWTANFPFLEASKFNKHMSKGNFVFGNFTTKDTSTEQRVAKISV